MSKYKWKVDTIYKPSGKVVGTRHFEKKSNAQYFRNSASRGAKKYAYHVRKM